MNASQPWYESALTLVKTRHDGKVDKYGRSYYQHFTRVTERLLADVPEATRPQVEAALLHDALEPGMLSELALRQAGITEEAIGLIRRITLPTDGRDYLQYIRGLVASGDVAAIQVKLADNADAIANHAADSSAESRDLLENRFRPSRQIMIDALVGLIALPADWSPALKKEYAANTRSGRVGTRLLAETDHVRVWETRLAPGERIPFHRHVLSYVWTALSSGTTRSHTMDGGGDGVRERSYVPGDSRYYEYGVGESRYHDLENIGSTELAFSIVEKLGSPNPALHLGSDTSR